MHFYNVQQCNCRRQTVDRQCWCVAPRGYPRIVESPTLKAVEKDRNTVMVCSATGNPEPSILWLKDYIPVDLSDPRIKLLHTGQCALADWSAGELSHLG